MSNVVQRPTGKKPNTSAGQKNDGGQHEQAGEALAEQNKLREQDVRDSDELYRAVIEQVSDAIFLLDVGTMRLLEANPAFQRLLGYSAEEISELSVYDLLPYEREHIDGTTRLALEQGEHRVSDLLYRRKDGVLINVEVGLTPVSYGGRRVLCEVLRDISERKRVEEALRRNEQELNDFFENAALGLHWVGADGTVLRVNQAELDLLGYTREEYIGRHIADFHADPDVIADILQRLTRGETLHNYQARLLCKDGTIKHVLISSNVMRKDGRFVHTRCFTRDITDRVELERRKDNFIALASHELKTPITSVKIHTQLLKRRLEQAGDTQTVEQLSKMNGQLDKLTELVQRLLDASKIEAGKLDYSMGEFALDELVSETVQDLQWISDKHTIVYDRQRRVEVVADKERIRQVLINLVTNAIKYSPNADRVVISSRMHRESDPREGAQVTQGGEQVLVSVQDFGIGISKREQARIFERFFQVSGPDSQHAETYPGLGLGLYISAEIIKRHGGRIWVESRVGKGSIFHFTLPTTVSAPVSVRPWYAEDGE